MLTHFALRDEVEKNGFVVRNDTLSSVEVIRLIAAMDLIEELRSSRKRGGTFAVRNLLDTSVHVRNLANSPVVRGLVEPVLGPESFAVRGILFDKIPGANWKVPWHQDVTIEVQEKIETDGFGPWSIKARIVHVQAPAFVLERMISIRIHLDPCGESNGALKVIPGSHRQGRIPEEEIASIRSAVPERICAVNAGGALLMRPLLIHASSSSEVPDHRRVIHIDFAAVKLPNGMRWFTEHHDPDVCHK